MEGPGVAEDPACVCARGFWGWVWSESVAWSGGSALEGKVDQVEDLGGEAG